MSKEKQTPARGVSKKAVIPQPAQVLTPVVNAKGNIVYKTKKGKLAAA